MVNKAHLKYKLALLSLFWAMGPFFAFLKTQSVSEVSLHRANSGRTCGLKSVSEITRPEGNFGHPIKQKKKAPSKAEIDILPPKVP